jgi:hypothetical protein
MTEVRKHDKPDEPNYPGGEDEDRGTHETGAENSQKQKHLDETDTGPATAADDTGEG